MSLSTSLWLQLSNENEAVLADPRDIWGLFYVGILIIILWLAFRKLKGLSDDNPKSE